MLAGLELAFPPTAAVLVRDQLLERFPECQLHCAVCLIPSDHRCLYLGTGHYWRVGSRRSGPSPSSTVASMGSPTTGSALEYPCAGSVAQLVQQLTVRGGWERVGAR